MSSSYPLSLVTGAKFLHGFRSRYRIVFMENNTKFSVYRDKTRILVINRFGVAVFFLQSMRDITDLYEFNAIVEKLLPIYKQMLNVNDYE